ncbi:hypothetical protein [Candidatus Williamhamiltonella defendens]|nr:hypothetical protein [Candidatus Hamiltonella defensa]
MIQIDVDLQDPINVIPMMIKNGKEGLILFCLKGQNALQIDT